MGTDTSVPPPLLSFFNLFNVRARFKVYRWLYLPAQYTSQLQFFTHSQSNPDHIKSVSNLQSNFSIPTFLLSNPTHRKKSLKTFFLSLVINYRKKFWRNYKRVNSFLSNVFLGRFCYYCFSSSIIIDSILEGGGLSWICRQFWYFCCLCYDKLGFCKLVANPYFFVTIWCKLLILWQELSIILSKPPCKDANALITMAPSKA